MHIRALVDSGSALTLINKKIFDKISTASKLKPIKLNLSTANGSSLTVFGCSFITFKIGKDSYRHAFIVAENLARNIILGRDFLVFNRADIKFSTRQLKLRNSYYNLTNDQHIGSLSRLSAPTRLSPQTAYMLKARVRKNPYFKRGHDLFFVPPSTGLIAENPCLTVMSSIIRITHNSFLVNVINNSNEFISLRKNTILGELIRPSDIHDSNVKTDNDSQFYDRPPKKSVNNISITNISDEDFIAKANIDDKYKPIITDFLIKNKLTFALCENDLLTTDLQTCDIETTDQIPINIKQYRIPLKCRKVISDTVSSLLEANIIRRSNSPYNFPVIVVSKKGDTPGKPGKSRMVIDLRALNSKTILRPQSLERVEDIVTRLRGSKFFTTLDLRSGFYQIPLTPQASDKCSFTTFNGRYQFIKMPFGLNNAPSVFSSMMHKLLAGLEETTISYVDDILIHSGGSIQDHLEKVQIVLDRLIKHKLRLKVEKCQWAQSQINYLGFIINDRGMTPQPEKIKAVKDLKPPTTVKGVRSFLGLISFYRMFIPQFSDIASPLVELTKKFKRFSWSPECQAAFESLRHSLSIAPLLHYPDTSKPYVLWSDASQYSVGAVLTQSADDTEGSEHPVYFLSHKLTTSQVRSYSVTEKELYGIHYAINKLDYYLRNSPFEIRTDHLPLKYLFSAEQKNTRCQKWALTISSYQCTIKYYKGSKMIADLLSRIRHDDDAPSSDYEDVGLENALPIETVINSNKLDASKDLAVTDEALKSVETHIDLPVDLDITVEQQQDDDIKLIVKRLRDNKADKQTSQHFVVLNDTLYYIESPDDKAILRLYIPKHLVSMVLTAYHEELGHFGILKTYHAIKTKYYWPKLYKDVLKKVDSCVTCKQRNLTQKQVPIHERDIPVMPNSIVQCDLQGPFPVSLAGNKYLCTFTDTYSGWPEAFPMRSKSADSVIECLLEFYIPRHSCMRVLVTDNGREFVNEKFESTLKSLNISHVKTSPYHPQANGMVERSHRTLNDILSKLSNGQAQTWDLHINQALMAIRCHVSATTLKSPFELIYHRPPILPLDNLLEPRRKTLSEDYHKIVLQNLHRAFVETAKQARKSMKDRVRIHNKNLQPHTFDVGDHVLLKNNNRENKLDSKWLPNYIITQKNGPSSFILLNTVSGKEYRAHGNNIRKTNLLWSVPKGPNIRRAQLVTSPPSSSQSDVDSSSTESQVPIDRIPRQVRNKMLEKSNTDSDDPLNEFQIRKAIRNVNAKPVNNRHKSNSTDHQSSSHSEYETSRDGPV